MHSITAKIQAHILYIHHILIITPPPPLYLTYMHNVQLTTLKCQIEENNNCQYQPKNNKSKQHTLPQQIIQLYTQSTFFISNLIQQDNSYHQPKNIHEVNNPFLAHVHTHAHTHTHTHTHTHRPRAPSCHIHTLHTHIIHVRYPQ